jgi:hypothetical protein
MYLSKYKNVPLVLIVFALLLMSVLAGISYRVPKAYALPAIPDECNSIGDSNCCPSNLDPDPMPPFPSVCSTIPPGCPGSTSDKPSGLPLSSNGALDTSSCPYQDTSEGIDSATTKYACGSGKDEIHTSMNLGCRGNACAQGSQTGYCAGNNGAIVDMVFAIIRFLSDGVGLVVVGSIVYAGIQYTTSRGDPNATAMAIKRIRSAITALLIFIFAYAILNYVIPAGFFK